MRITYAHCVKFTPGQLDRYPHSAYETREIDVQVWRLPAIPECPWENFHVKTLDGVFLGEGDDITDAVSEAKYRLMDQSREAAKKLSASAQGMEVRS